MTRRSYAGASSRSPRQTAEYARHRVNKIIDLIIEIETAYGGVDNFIEQECERLRLEVRGLGPQIAEAEREGRSL
jgi:hypothetical protein